jgi:uncharacterized integral membrane protein
MVRLIVYFFAVASLVIFASQNLETVPVYMIAGGPFNVPLIVVIALSFFVGFAAAIVGVIFRAVKGGNRTKALPSVPSRRPLM